MDQGGGQVTEMSEQSGEVWKHSNVFSAARLTATYDYNSGNGGLHYELADPLGSKRVQANTTGIVEEWYVSLPYGDGLTPIPNPACTAANYCYAEDATEHHFTGKERDTESGNDYFEARYYSSAMGRFMSPDWSAKEEPVPYAKLDNPQSLNLYAYVMNNPMDRTDPDGHGCVTVFGHTFCMGAPPPLPPPPATPAAPAAPPIAQLKTDMKGGTTSFTVSTHDKTTTTTIETQNKVDSRSKPGANDPYSTPNIKGVVSDSAHADKPEYGPAGAFINTGDSRGRAIHGGGSGLTDGTTFDDKQSKLMPTFGCTRGFNADVINLGKSITSFQQANPDVQIPYERQ